MPLFDPRGVLLGEVERVKADATAMDAWRALRDHLSEVIALAEPTGSSATRDAFAALGVDVRLRHDAGHFMWTLLEAALGLKVDHYFLPDSDRLLHWLLSYPSEL